MVHVSQYMHEQNMDEFEQELNIVLWDSKVSDLFEVFICRKYDIESIEEYSVDLEEGQDSLDFETMGHDF